MMLYYERQDCMLLGQAIYPVHAFPKHTKPGRSSLALLLDLGGNGGFAVHDPVFGQGTFALSRPAGFGGNQPSLEEIEAQLSRTAGAQPHMQMQQERKMMSLEEVEAALMNINGGRPIYSEAMIAEQQAKQARLEQRRAERQAKQADIVSYSDRTVCHGLF